MTRVEAVERARFLEGADPRGGALVPPLTAFHLTRPWSIRVAGDRLVFRNRMNPSDPGAVEVAPSRRVLEEFLELANDKDGRGVERFAKAWGPLGVCRHDRSLLSCGQCREPRLMPDLSAGRLFAHWEPLETWRRLAREVGAFVHMAYSLQKGQSVRAADAEVFGSQLRGFYLGSTVAEQQRLFAVEISVWLSRAGTRPWFTWNDGKQIRGLGFDGVFGAVGAQLFALLGTPFAVCASCGDLFELERQPRAGSRSWCLKHKCQLARGAQVARDFRERERTAKASRSRSTPKGKLR